MDKSSEDMNGGDKNFDKPTVVPLSETQLQEFKGNMVAKDTKKSTETAIRRLQQWYISKYVSELQLNKISKKDVPQLLKYFFVEIRQTTKEKKRGEYEPDSLQTYRNGLRR